MRLCRGQFVPLVLQLVAAGSATAQNREHDSIIPRIDHLVYATPDLNRGIAEIEALLGIRATIGGRHPGRGTYNALIALGPRVYLEILAPDPTQSGPVKPEVFQIDTLVRSKLITWSANATSLDEIVKLALTHRIPVGVVGSGSRVRPDGVTLSWRYTDPNVEGTDGIIPFFLDWGGSPHPAATSPAGARLVEFRAEHPNPAVFRDQLRQLGLVLRIDVGPLPALIAIIESPRGRVELR